MNENKAYVFDPVTQTSRVLDFDNPDKGMYQQMADVMMNRLGNPSVLKMLYLDPKMHVPEVLRNIIQELVDQKITTDQAKEQIVAWKNAL